MVKRFLKYIPGPDADFVASRPFADLLLKLIATRARREPSADGLETGECFVGDYASIGATRGQYREAVKFLKNNGYIEVVETCRTRKRKKQRHTSAPLSTTATTTQTTTVATKVKLCGSRVWDLNLEANNHRNNQQHDHPTTTEQPQTKNSKNGKKKKDTSSGGAGGAAVFFDPASQQFVGITDQLLQLWQTTYPQLDINQELGKMSCWLLDPNKPKRKGNQSFIQSWLSRAEPSKNKITPIEDAPELPDDPEIEALLARRDAACMMK